VHQAENDVVRGALQKGILMSNIAAGEISWFSKADLAQGE
jgi:hypothetical protein